MSCTFSREALALHIEGDLTGVAAEIASSHLAACPECRRFLDQLRVRQSLLKSLRRVTATPSECAGMRREVMSILNDSRDRLGWALRIERAIVLGFRRHSYALAAAALLGIVSVSLLTERRHIAVERGQLAAVFEGGNSLVRPEGYRDWIAVGRSEGPRCAGADHTAAVARCLPGHRVYVNPSGFREFVRTGRFPEGTLIVLESVDRESKAADRLGTRPSGLLVSAKDSSRFEGGWAFFDFGGPEGTITSKARPLPDSSGCRTCHREDAETDHVFTQFYPVLRSARLGAVLTAPSQGQASLTGLLALLRSPAFPRTSSVVHS